MNLSIFAKIVEKEGLSNLLNELHSNSQFKYIIVASWQDIWFEYFDPSRLTQVINSEWGRVFGENLELRWRRDEEGENFMCRWIAENVSVPQVQDAKEFPKLEFEVHEESFLLWGMPVRDDGGWVRDSKGQRIWYVTRIPRVLVYPIDEAMAKIWENGQTSQERQKPLCLRVRFYMRGGRAVFDRFVELEPYFLKGPKSQSKGG